MHQLPASPSNLRVRTWRRLQELGAVALKQSVYVLPDSAEAREDFECLLARARHDHIVSPPLQMSFDGLTGRRLIVDHQDTIGHWDR